MEQENTDIYGSLVLNIDQAKFKELVLDCIEKLCKFKKDVNMMRKTENGYYYDDYVVTIKVSRDKRSCEVWRNRTGTLVFAMDDLKNIAMNYQYIFLIGHLTDKLKRANG